MANKDIEAQIYEPEVKKVLQKKQKRNQYKSAEGRNSKKSYPLDNLNYETFYKRAMGNSNRNHPKSYQS